ncbi:glutathione S-transferase family protein [Streptomyces sp. PRKS01-65]|nr:glutathione S-transferase C-terminal domain-containing protein [Streptomyces harenosi]NEY35181.1 glutathione S-transferase family protein [Streptomyces harenosi]
MPATPSPAVPSRSPLPAFRGRIGPDSRSGHYAVPGRYRLHLSPSCPHCLTIAVTHGLLGLDDVLPVTPLPAVPDEPDGGYAALRPLYEAGCHRYPGPAAAPVLSDAWTGRIVSNHAPDILSDLARRFGDGGPGHPTLYPRGAEGEIEAVARLCGQGIDDAAQRAGRADATAAEREAALTTLLRALHTLEWRLASREYVLGDELTAADVRLWVALVHLDVVHRRHLDAAAVHRVAGHRHLWSYARRLAAHPAFGPRLDLDGMARGHRARCRGLEAAGAALGIVDWTAHAREGVRTGAV